jgi:uncharacterized protein YaiI (UPF0178 family)
MTIFVDADSCPKQARELVIRFSVRTKVHAVFAANRPIPGIMGETVTMEICPPGEGAADNRIAERARPGDLVVTRDIPLAERLVGEGILVLDDRGRIYTPENIREHRSLRDFMVGLAENGLGADRISSYGKKELKSFADSLDKELTRLMDK